MDNHVAPSKGKGRGVFAGKNFRQGETIEVCPVVVLSAQDRKRIDRTALYNYYFGWSGGRAAIGLGYSSIYNHSYRPNAKYVKDFRERVLRYVCVKPIRKGEEILVNYNGDPDSQKPVWFDEKGATQRSS